MVAMVWPGIPRARRREEDQGLVRPPPPQKGRPGPHVSLRLDARESVPCLAPDYQKQLRDALPDQALLSTTSVLGASVLGDPLRAHRSPGATLLRDATLPPRLGTSSLLCGGHDGHTLPALSRASLGPSCLVSSCGLSSWLAKHLTRSPFHIQVAETIWTPVLTVTSLCALQGTVTLQAQK